MSSCCGTCLLLISCLGSDYKNLLEHSDIYYNYFIVLVCNFLEVLEVFRMNFILYIFKNRICSLICFDGELDTFFQGINAYQGHHNSEVFHCPSICTPGTHNSYIMDQVSLFNIIIIIIIIVPLLLVKSPHTQSMYHYF